MTNLKLMLLRKQKRKTQEWVADKADCNRITYNRVGNGDVPGLKTAIGIAKALNIETIAELEDVFFNKNVQDRTIEVSE